MDEHNHISAPGGQFAPACELCRLAVSNAFEVLRQMLDWVDLVAEPVLASRAREQLDNWAFALSLFAANMAAYEASRPSLDNLGS